MNTATDGADDRTFSVPPLPRAPLHAPPLSVAPLPLAPLPLAPLLVPGRREPGAPSGAWRDPMAWAIAALVCGAYLALSLFRLFQLDPTSWDLGIYTEYVKQLSLLHAPVVDVRGPGFDLLGDHFQVGLAVLAPFFRVFPSPATLLFFQALATAVSVFPVVAAGTALAGRTTGRLIGIGYGFSWGLQQMIEFDFHEIALAVPLLAFSLSALVRRRPAAAIWWAMPLVFLKEDQGFTVAAIGAYLVVSALRPRLAAPLSGLRRGTRGARRSRDPRSVDAGDLADYRYTALWGGLFLVGWGLFWSVFAITVVIPHFSTAHEYYYWKDGGVVGGGRAFSALGLVAQTADGWPVKLQTVFLLLLPTAFAALGSPAALLALPSLALRFMSTNTAYWGTDWHYNGTIMPILFIAAAEAIGRWQRLPGSAAARAPARTFGAPRPGLSGPALGGSVAGSAFGGAVAGPAFGGAALAGSALAAGVALRRGVARHGPAMMAAVAVALAFQFPLNDLWHSATYRIDAHARAADAAMAVVPDGATVQTTLGMLAPLAARTDTFWIGNAGNPLTQYVVFDNDDSGYSPAVKNVPAFIAAMYPNDGYVEVFQRDHVYVFRR